MWLVPDKRNVPAIRFLEYTEDYARTTLGKIGNTYNGLTGKSAEDFGQGSPYITYKSIFDNSRVDISRVEYVQISDIEQHNKKQNKVARGDIFFTTSSETPEEVGMTSVLLDNIEDCYLNSFCFGYRVYSQEQYLPEYLRFYLRSSIIRKKLFVLAQGSTRFNLSKNEVMRISINMPKALEQRKIARFLTLLEERITTQNKIIEKLETLIKGIIELAFSHAATSNTLGCYITQISQRNKIGKDLPVLSVSNKYGFVEQSEQFDDRVIASDDTSNYKIVNINDFAYNPARINVGSIARLKNKECGIVSPMYICFRTLGNIIPEYLELFFKTKQFSFEVNKRLEGSVRLCLQYEGLCEIVIPVLPVDKQQIWVTRITALYAKLAIEKGLQNSFQAQKQFLLSQMFI